MALLLGVLAGIFDVLPMIGIFLALAPAVLMGLTVSPQTALIIVGYIGYHLLGDYFIVPKVTRLFFPRPTPADNVRFEGELQRRADDH